MTANQNDLNFGADLIKELAPNYSIAEVEALKECCQQLLNAYGACAEDNSSLPLTLEDSLSSLLKQIISNEDVSSYFGFYSFLESPDDEDNRDTYWDCYCDFVQDPHGVSKRMKDQF